MKLGIGLIIIGTIFLLDGIAKLIFVAPNEPIFFAGAFVEFIIATVLFFFGIRRVRRKRQKEGQK